MVTTNSPISIAAVFGTRPEAVKLLPVIRALRHDERFRLLVGVTGQHREMLDEILQPFGVVPDTDLDIMQTGQSLNDIVCRDMQCLDALYAREKPDLVLVQGDTTSAFCAALAAFDRRIAVAHVEAGLRSFDRFHPYPEECNRRMVSAVTDLHFAPTGWASQNLLAEGVPRNHITVTGNTVVDALLLTLREQHGDTLEGAPAERRMVLVTLHRREALETPSSNGGESVLDDILTGIRRAAERHPDVDFIYPVHLNPKVQKAAHRVLAGAPNVRLTAPLPYVEFVRAMASATAIVSDSGGVQEEAPSLGVPVLVLRRTTERPEAVQAGANQLIGTDPKDIERALSRVLDGPSAHHRGSIPRPNPFGDGHATERIVQALLFFCGQGEAPEEFAGTDVVRRPVRWPPPRRRRPFERYDAYVTRRGLRPASEAICRAARRTVLSLYDLWHRCRSRRGSRRRSRAWRRDHFDAYHRHGCHHAHPRPDGHSSFRRRRSPHVQRHRRNHPSQNHAPDQSGHRHASLRQSMRDG